MLSGEQVLRQENLDAGKRTAATLAPVIQATLKWCRGNELFPHFVTIADGPGSFTGLRIGITTAKTLGYSLALPVIGVDSVAAIAAAAFRDSPTINSLLVGIDAYRQQVFAGEFKRSDLLPTIDAIPAAWSAHPETVGVLDDSRWRERLEQRLEGTGVTGEVKPLREFAELSVDRECDAIGVGLLGIRAAVRGEFVDPMVLVPRYLKLSAAEEKAAGQFPE